MRITANQVTMARVFLLPVPIYLLIYGDSLHWWIAFALFVLLGATDFVDGLMARREGPTKLGSLIDPVADKIFIASIMLSMVAIGIFPAWIVSILLTREFLVTALRSSVAIREQTIKTSMLAKLKTIVQMGGCGTIFLTIVLSSSGVIWANVLLALAFLSITAVYSRKKLSPPFWATPVGLAFILVALVELIFTKQINLMMQVLIILTLTWVSAIDYLVGSYLLFKRTGLRLGDWLRILWSIVLGVFVVPLVSYFPIIVLPVLVCVSLEFGLGGIDNIVVAEEKRFSTWPFALSSLSGLLFAIGVNASIFWQMPSLPFYFSVGLSAVSALICGAAFGRNAHLFTRSLK